MKRTASELPYILKKFPDGLRMVVEPQKAIVQRSTGESRCQDGVAKGGSLAEAKSGKWRKIVFYTICPAIAYLLAWRSDDPEVL